MPVKPSPLILLIIVLSFLVANISHAMTFKHLIVFGDSMSDRGHTEEGGFNRYSNGKVWPEYLAEKLCQNCLEDYAWGGATTAEGNYHGFNWSGVLWQIARYRLKFNADDTLHVIWAGENDILMGDKDSASIAHNLIMALDKLIAKGAKHILLFTQPDFSLAPAYNDPATSDYKIFNPKKNQTKIAILNLNAELRKEIQLAIQVYKTKMPTVHLYLIDIETIFNELKPTYENSLSPWNGTYQFPKKRGYLWWDSWHPMTSVHADIATYIEQTLKKHHLTFSK